MNAPESSKQINSHCSAVIDFYVYLIFVPTQKCMIE